MKKLVLLMILLTAGWVRPWSSIARGQVEVCRVSTTQGDVRGIDRGQSCEFRAVPFASAPIGSLRWTPPVPAAPWAPAVLDATGNPPICPQFNLAGLPVGTEDCLKLISWAPHPGSKPPLPVIVDFEGGKGQYTLRKSQAPDKSAGTITLTPGTLAMTVDDDSGGEPTESTTTTEPPASTTTVSISSSPGA